MYEYLTPPALRPIRTRNAFIGTEMPDDGFPVDEVFCLVGSNPEDYDAAWGLSCKAVGARSDGLVQIDNAAVRRAPLAVVHRSHSGRRQRQFRRGLPEPAAVPLRQSQIQVELVGFAVAKAAQSAAHF
ncbi:hypothetical protein [Pseudarthrobacter sp. NamB4]|uniref:hypothetical protein n=1 Tax=Pseudarthrobacter sp. NamB4 TaxID=2576837 RepID=UPI001F0DA286|nr:hypothetical protein [Pseudarthrobacter sp. NamB4]